MLELLRKLDGGELLWESIADAMLGQAAGGSRQARRSAEVQKKARRIRNVVSTVSARFSAKSIDELCTRRSSCASALLEILDKVVHGLHVSRSAADTPSEPGKMSLSQIDSMGEPLPDWTAYDLHLLSMHAMNLTELATEVNVLMREAFGGNFPELVWASDCYEYNPAHAHKDMQPILANQTALAEAVEVLSLVISNGLVSSSAPAAAAPAPAASAPAPTTVDERPSSSRRRGGKKKKGGRVHAHARVEGEGEEASSAGVQQSSIEDQD